MLTFKQNYFLYTFYFPLYKFQLTFTKYTNWQNIYVYIQPKLIIYYNKINLLDIHYSLISCLDISAFQKNNQLFIFNQYLNYWTYTNILLFYKTWNSFTIEKFFKNSLFIERELKEMFGVIIYNLSDTRNLLLDYTYNFNPLLKNFNCEGYLEIYLNLFNDKLQYINTNYIEL